MDGKGEADNRDSIGAACSDEKAQPAQGLQLDVKKHLIQLKEDFGLVSKRILKTELSTNPNTLIKYKTDIIESYRIVIKYLSSQYNVSSSENQKKFLLETSDYYLTKFEKCLEKLNCRFILPASLFDPIEPELIKIIGIETTGEDFPEQNIYLPHSTTPEPPEMALTKVELMKAASSYMNKPYNGDPLGLSSFIDSCKLLQSLATTEELKTFLATLIRTKVDGRARDFLTATIVTVEDIITTLESNIKHDNSKIIEGRMLSLKLTQTNQEDFAAKTENLADALRRTLIIEGMTATKATELSIEKTIELCRNNAHNDLVKSVLEATAYTSPKEVVAKLIVQRDKAKNEAQILSFRQQRINRDPQGPRQNFKQNVRRNNFGNNSNNNFGNAY